MESQFHGDDRNIVAELLLSYGEKAIEPGADRVRLGILDLCSGDVQRVRQLVQMAKADYRDLLMAAEYTGQAYLGVILRRLPIQTPNTGSASEGSK